MDVRHLKVLVIAAALLLAVEQFAKYEPLTYEVDGLPPNRLIRIQRRMVPIEPARWSILPVTLLENDLGVNGPWTGDYASPEDALAAIDEAFLQDPAHWRDP